ncbi:MAG: hypothetical protein H0Z29_05365 [Candidatus Marinimicrobia bacterium]|nr:hypothetical protein [Candidatus Neomarinimicrobiota bacterium]
MEIKRNRLISLILFIFPIILISLVLIFRVDNGYIYSPIFIAIAIVMGYLYYRNLPLYIFKSDNNGIYIRGCKTGFYDKDFISYNEIFSINRNNNKISLKLKDGAVTEIKLPKR